MEVYYFCLLIFIADVSSLDNSIVNAEQNDGNGNKEGCQTTSCSANVAMRQEVRRLKRAFFHHKIDTKKVVEDMKSAWEDSGRLILKSQKNLASEMQQVLAALENVNRKVTVGTANQLVKLNETIHDVLKVTRSEIAKEVNEIKDEVKELRKEVSIVQKHVASINETFVEKTTGDLTTIRTDLTAIQNNSNTLMDQMTNLSSRLLAGVAADLQQLNETVIAQSSFFQSKLNEHLVDLLFLMNQYLQQDGSRVNHYE